MSAVERARPWLGTLVSVRVNDLEERKAGEAIDAAFAEIAHVHRCMSFHDVNSDLSRLIRQAHVHPVTVNPYTFRVLSAADSFAKCSGGSFDITVACELTANGLLPAHHAVTTCGEARWSDIELLPGSQVYFRRPLLIDLGGIGKGFAVDCATQRLQEMGVRSAVVNAGGDLRVIGDEEETILLDVPGLEHARPYVRLQEGSLASSYAVDALAEESPAATAVHWHGQERTPAASSRFVSVAAKECMTADALTKVVLCKGLRAESILQRWEAKACLFDGGSGWRYLNLDSSGSSV